MSFYKLFLFIHILSAIISIGPLFGIFPLLNRMKKTDTSQTEGFILSLQGILKAISNGGRVLVPSGLILIWLGGWSWTTSWVVLTFIIMMCTLLFLARAFKPAMNLVDTTEFTKEKFISMMTTATWKYISLMSILLWLMVAKPHFW
ncbi:DUF2269 family protein [Solibacillus sp. FSL H8-0538]|uniref:DUF2269 family protein n=1 Tax=Solibacillus sp. FSL H8-0538 TaxID=2921400 RepID=UPI0030FB795A